MQAMFDRWDREAQESMVYRDRRATLSPDEMLRWQLFRRNTRGKLLDLSGKTHAYRFEGRPNDLSKLKYAKLEAPGPS